MRSKRSRQHAARRIAKRVAALLVDRSALNGTEPIYRMIDAKLKSAYVTLGAQLAMSMYLSEHE